MRPAWRAAIFGPPRNISETQAVGGIGETQGSVGALVAKGAVTAEIP